MKKVLSFILVLSMVLSSFGMAFAAPAKNEIAGHLNEDATLRLSDLGIVKGDDRGFALDANITRAEFAVLLVRALGLEGSANVAKGETQFTDVTVAAGYEWASGAINVATRLGYIQGYGNGKFGPADSIRYEDAITLVVRALGYEPAAQAKGGYPVGYLVVAEQDIQNTKHVEGAQGVAIKRGPVFQLLDNSLTKAKMIQVGYGNDTKYVVSGNDNTNKETILTSNLGFKEIEGTVVANHRVEKLKANEIKINVEKVNGSKVTAKNEKFEISDKFDFDVDAVLGLKVSAWYNDDKEELFRYETVTDEDQILHDTINKVVEKSKSREDYFETTPVVLDDEVKFNEDAIVYVNNVKEDAEYLEKESAKLGTNETLSYYGRIVLNEYKEIEFAYLFDFSADMVGMAQELKTDEVKFVNVDSAKEDVIELDDADEVFVFNPDFSKASLEDIEAGTAVFGWVDEDDNYFLVVKNDRVEGKLGAVRVANNRITVDGTNVSKAANAIFSGNQGEDYDYWTKDNFKDVEEFIDEKVIVVLDLAGKAMVLTTDVDVTSSTIYGVATYLTDGRNPVLTVYTNEGKEVEYKFEDRSDVKTTDYDLTAIKYLDEEFAAVSFKVNKDSEIVEDSLKVVTEAKEVQLTKADSKHRYVTDKAGNKYNVRTNTVVVKAFNSSNKLKPSLIKYDDIIKKEFSNQTAVVIGEIGKDASIIVFTDSKFQATEDSKYGVVTGEPERVTGGDYKVEVDVAGEGKVTYVLASRTEVKKGDLVRFTLDNKGQLVAENKLNTKDTGIAKHLKVVTDEIDEDYLELDGTAYLVDTKETPIYKVNDLGNLQSNTVNLSRVKKGDVVLMITDLENDDVIRVLVVVTEHRPVVEETEDQKAAKAVEAKIDALPAEITLAEEDAVVEARAAYDALNAAAKKLVENLATLEAAEAKIAELKEEEPVKEVTAEATFVLEFLGVKSYDITIEGANLEDVTEVRVNGTFVDKETENGKIMINTLAETVEKIELVVNGKIVLATLK